ncbi:MAG: nucleotidyltransferase domain-containing protein [Trueperaceae bacterium]|nr:nucleotidyltransferase domain-containing protein [Trueperaceae bacterium]
MASSDPADITEQVTDVLRRDPDILVAYLFGSAAQGGMTPDSDVDVGVLASGPLETEQRTRLVREIAAATGHPLDLVDLRTAGVPLLQAALSKGRPLICRDRRTRDQLITKMLADVEDFLPLRRRLLEARRNRWIR